MSGLLDRPSLVAGIFDSEAEAARAIEALIEAHIDPQREISVIASRRGQREEVPIDSVTHPGQGASTGALLGAAFGAASVGLFSFTAFPLGLLAAGPVVALLEGAVAGGGVGALAGVLTGLGRVDEQARFSEIAVRDGVIWVGVNAEGHDLDAIRTLLREHGARHLRSQPAG